MLSVMCRMQVTQCMNEEELLHALYAARISVSDTQPDCIGKSTCQDAVARRASTTLGLGMLLVPSET